MTKNIITFFLLIMITSSGCKKYENIFKDGYTSGEDKSTATGASSDSLLNDFSKLSSASIFPGLVSSAEVRGSFDIAIDLSKKYIIPEDIKVLVTPSLWYNTGLYAPPGEVFTVTVPAGVNGLSVRVGSWVQTLNVDVLKRDPQVSLEIQLTPGKNYIRNLYGGTIYINNYSKIQTHGTQVLKFAGVVKSADFVLGESNDTEWNERVRQSATPWFQLRGKRIVFELPKRFLDRFPISNPTQLMEEWDKVIASDIYFWKGLEDVTTDSLNKAPETPIRVIMDIQILNNFYGIAGSPITINMNENDFIRITNLQVLKTKGAWSIMNVIGVNYLTHIWMPSYLQVAGINLYNLKMADRLHINLANMNDSMKMAIDTGLLYVKKNLNLYANNMNSNANFAKDIVGYTNYNLIKLLPFIQLFDNYGYDLYTLLDYSSRHLYSNNYLNDNQKTDYIYTTICNARRIDFIPFFEMWGLRVSPAVAAAIKQQYPRLQLDIYNYNPLLPGPMHGMTGSVPPPNRDVNKLNWSILEFCCQELQAGYYPVSLCIDYADTTYWRTQWFATQNLPSHKPHYFVIDMNAFQTLGGFWYANPPLSDDGRFTPKNIRVYVDTSIVQTTTDFAWKQVLSVTGPNNNLVKNIYDFKQNNKDITYKTRYIRIEIDDSNTADPFNQNSISLAEIGVLGSK